MEPENQRIRSPNFPRVFLREAIEAVEALYKKAARSTIKKESAATALGYSGLTGSSLSMLGALNQYGLIDTSKGDVKVSEIAVRIIHPIDEGSKRKALRDAALSPVIFSTIYAEWGDMDEQIIANQLIHRDFTVEAAKRCAVVYKDNYALANLAPDPDAAPVASSDPANAKQAASVPSKPSEPSARDVLRALGAGQPSNVLAHYKVPVGQCVAEITITGDNLIDADFDELRDFLEYCKKQHGRKSGASRALSLVEIIPVRPIQ